MLFLKCKFVFCENEGLFIWKLTYIVNILTKVVFLVFFLEN